MRLNRLPSLVLLTAVASTPLAGCDWVPVGETATISETSIESDSMSDESSSTSDGETSSDSGETAETSTGSAPLLLVPGHYERPLLGWDTVAACEAEYQPPQDCLQTLRICPDDHVQILLQEYSVAGVWNLDYEMPVMTFPIWEGLLAGDQWISLFEDGTIGTPSIDATQGGGSVYGGPWTLTQDAAAVCNTF